jgi:hypothetical protein
MTDIRITKHDLAWHVLWTDAEGWGHVVRVATIYDALKIAEGLENVE